MNSQAQRGDAHDDSLIIYIIGTVIFIGLLYFGANYALQVPAYEFTHFMHHVVNNYPYFQILVPNQVNIDLENEYRFARYMIPENRVIQELDVCLSYFYPLVFVLFLKRLSKVAKKTKASTYRQKIDTLDQIVKMKEEDFPFMKSAYLFGEEMVKNPDLQDFGRYSQEYGPVRWSILHGILYIDGQKLVFEGKEPKDEDNYFPVKNVIPSLAPLSGKLTVNINKLSELFKAQINRPYSSVKDLKNYEVAICIMFLTYAKGYKFKSAAQTIRNNNANCVVSKKLETKREVHEFKYKAENGYMELESLIKHHNSKLLTIPRHTNQFILSCYALAKLNGADVTPPDFSFLKGFDRELYLLLHTYSGDPKVIKNNGYIECTAPLTAFLNLYEIFVIDKSNNVSDSSGFYPPIVAWQNLLLSQVCKEKIVVEGSITFISGLTKKESNLIQTIKKSKDQQKEDEDSDTLDLRNALNSSKLIKKISPKLQLNPEEKKAIASYNFNSFSDQCFAILMMKYEQALKNIGGKYNPDSVVSAFIKNYGWMEELDSKFFLKFATSVYLMVTHNISFKSLVGVNLSSPEASDIGETISKVIPYKHLDLKSGRVVTQQKKEVVPSHYISLSYGWIQIVQYKTSIAQSKYSTQELMSLATNVSITIEKSIRSYLYQMTTIEKWLSDEYNVTTEQLLESDPTKFIRSRA